MKIHHGVTVRIADSEYTNVYAGEDTEGCVEPELQVERHKMAMWSGYEWCIVVHQLLDNLLCPVLASFAVPQ